MLLQQEEELLKEVQSARETEEKAVETILNLEAENDEIKPTEDGGIEVVASRSADPPDGTGPSVEEIQQENHILKAELDMVKAEYAEKLSQLEEAETSIRLDLAAKIDELHNKNEARKEALSVATDQLKQEGAKLHDLKKRNDELENRVLELETENAKQTVALVKAQLHPADSTSEDA